MKLRRGALSALCFAGVVSIIIFFTGYRNIGNIHPELILQKTKLALGYFVMYLGMPFGAANQAIGLSTGVVSLLLLVALWVIAWRRKEFSSPIVIVCVGIALLTVATAAITTLSRLPMDNRPFSDGIVIPGRYVNFTAHYWAALTTLLIWTAERTWPKSAWLVVLSLTALFAGTLPRTGEWVKVWMGFYAGYQYATLAVESGVKTDAMLQVLNYTDATLVCRSLGDLERRHLALYSWGRHKAVGQPLALLGNRLAGC